MGETVGEQDWLAHQFEAHRAHLGSVARQMLGARGEAEDAVQETWLRLSRSNAAMVENLGSWLTTAVARVCLDMLRARAARREALLDAHVPEPAVSHDEGTDPEHEAVLADSLGPALVVVLETLAPTERVAFVLHDVFGVPFDEIAPVIGRSPEATRQIASRARRKVRGATMGDATGDTASDRQRAVVRAFLLAARNGDFGALLTLLDPGVVIRADPEAIALGAAPEVRGAPTVAGLFLRRYRGTQLALLNGQVGLVWAPQGRPRVCFDVTLDSGRIVEFQLIAEGERLRQLDITILAG